MNREVDRLDSPGSPRARMRLGAVVGLAGLAMLFGGLGLRLYLAPPVNPVAGALLGVALGVGALAYALSARWVALRVRWGHLIGCVVTALGTLSISSGATWLDWVVLAFNLATFLLLVFSIPHRE